MSFAPAPTEVLVVGCGNLLRGDDAAGPILVRMLADRALPDGVRLIDGGTAGMDIAFAMRGVPRVVIVDASRVGVAPGTIHKVPGSELTDLRPPEGNLHSFRWDQALGFATWLLKDEYPADITVWLVFDEHADGRLREFLRSGHVWAVESPSNRNVAKKIWEESAVTHSLTLFDK